VAALLATYAAGLWLLGIIDNAIERWKTKARWASSRSVITIVRRSFLFWVFLVGLAFAVQVSSFPQETKSIIVKIVGSLFVLSFGWVVIVIIEHLLKAYLPRLRISRPTTIVAVNTVRVTIVIVGALVVLDLWGAPTTPLLLLIAIAVLASALALRNAAPHIFAGIQLGATRQIKVGDYIKLETGEEGYITDIGWSNTQLKVVDNNVIVVPNNRLLQQKIINYGRPLKKAREAFHFYSHTHLTELTGLQAKNLRELADILKQAPDTVIYYHTHRFFEEHRYLTPEPSNDFAIWISDALGEEALGERLAAVNTFEFPDLGALRERLVGIIEERLAKGSDSREAMTGREFYFMKSVSVVMPTPYFVQDLREFVETLRKISLSSLYFHLLESRLRLGKGLNDFTAWMKDSLGEDQLGEEIARFDPYTYTLEGLRLALIQLIEKRIK
jgi:small-conductance mechanosensitive channel